VYVCSNSLLEWQPQGHVIPLVFSLRSFFSLGTCS
jgi:hypothetical protein